MILFSFKETFENISKTVNSFLSSYGSNPVFWVLIFAIIITISYFAISSLGDK